MAGVIRNLRTKQETNVKLTNRDYQHRMGFNWRRRKQQRMTELFDYCYAKDVTKAVGMEKIENEEETATAAKYATAHSATTKTRKMRMANHCNSGI